MSNYHGRSAHAGLSTSSSNPAPTTSELAPTTSDSSPPDAQSHSHSHSHPHSHPDSHPDSHSHSTHPFSNPHEVLLPSVLTAPDHASANKAHYDANAANYDKMELAQQMAKRSAEAIRRVWEFDEGRSVVMDYACGTGLVSQQLAPYCKTLIGIDISQGMVDTYNKRVSDQGIPPNEMRALQADILSSPPGELPALEGMQFDVIVCSQAYHHIADIVGTTKALAGYLKPGGGLIVVDMLKSEGAVWMHTRKDAPEHVKHTVAHKGGLEESQVRECYEKAGLEGFELSEAWAKEVEGRRLVLFVAKGVKPAEAAEAS